jgi:hypothetical protein
MKKILSAVVVVALGWVAFDRVSQALELRDAADKATNAADAFKSRGSALVEALARAERDARATFDAANAGAIATAARLGGPHAAAIDAERDAAIDVARDAAANDVRWAFNARAERDARAAAANAVRDSRDATEKAALAVAVVAAALAVAIHLNRKTPSA